MSGQQLLELTLNGQEVGSVRMKLEFEINQRIGSAAIEIIQTYSWLQVQVQPSQLELSAGNKIRDNQKHLGSHFRLF